MGILPLLLLVLAVPEFSTERGLVDQPFTLRLEADEPILYSRDHTPPSQPWPGELTIDRTTTIRARLQSEPDAIATHTYLFVDDVLADPILEATILANPTYFAAIERTLRDLPAVALTTGRAPSGDEQAISFEWIDPTGLILQEDCGMALVGGASVNYAKNNLRLYFRNRYGAGRLDADLFEGFESGLPTIQSHDSLTLRSGSHDSVFWLEEQGQYLRNRWMDEVQLAMGHLAPHGRYVHLFLNGRYTGLYQARERFGAAFLAEHLGGDEDDYEAVNHGRTSDGTGAAWAQVVAGRDSYEAVLPWLDVENFIDYMLLQFYAANDWDWRHDHNWMAAGPSAPNRGGYVFHSSDSDVCLVYDWDTNILDNSGPSHVFGRLLAEGHPDFMTLLADRIHAQLEGDGPLTADATASLYARLAAQIEDAVVAESARWGRGWWDRDDEWLTEQDRLEEEFFPRRTIAMLSQVREAGWYPLDAPSFDVPWSAPGFVDPGARARVTAPGAEELWVRIGGDPRLPGGATAPDAMGPTGVAEIAIEHSVDLQARLKVGDVWGPLERVGIEVDADPAVVLNEWNAVAPGKELADGDGAWGVRPGNGGDWIELVVVEDHTDLRGWRVDTEDRAGRTSSFTFGDDPVFGDLRSGTLITVAVAMPEDLAYAPERGDWRFHVRVGGAATGDLAVSHDDWRLTLLDRDGVARFGPVGEGVGATEGVSSREVGVLAADPSSSLRRADDAWQGSDRSTFGAPNRWGNQRQSLAALRAVLPTEPLDAPADPPDDTYFGDSGCGGGAALALLVLLPLGLRRGSVAALLLLVACPPGPPPETPLSPAATCRPEVCDGRDNDCDGLVDDEDPDLVDGMPFFTDVDGDGWGGTGVVTACAAGAAAVVGGDCDDADDTIHPGAEETCDAVDRDCDGRSGDAAGLTEACAASSCASIVAEEPEAPSGVYWLELPSGTTAEVVCDMPGGWTLGFLRNSVDTGSQGDFGAGEVNIGGLSISPEDASAPDATVPVRSWLDLNALPWTELQVAGYAAGGRAASTTPIPRDLLRIDFGEPGYLLFGEAGYYWCGGPASYTDAGIGAVDNPAGATPDCKGHGSLGSGWDLSESDAANRGFTLCGGDGSSWLYTDWGAGRVSYGTPGGALAIWVR